jgi:hypothetical protein
LDLVIDAANVTVEEVDGLEAEAADAKGERSQESGGGAAE